MNKLFKLFAMTAILSTMMIDAIPPRLECKTISDGEVPALPTPPATPRGK